MATVEELEVKALVETTADTLSEIKVERFASTLRLVDFDAIKHAGSHAS